MSASCEPQLTAAASSACPIVSNRNSAVSNPCTKLGVIAVPPGGSVRRYRVRSQDGHGGAFRGVRYLRGIHCVAFHPVDFGSIPGAGRICGVPVKGIDLPTVTLQGGRHFVANSSRSDSDLAQLAAGLTAYCSDS